MSVSQSDIEGRNSDPSSLYVQWCFMVLFCGQLSDITLAAPWIPSSEPSAFVSGSTSGYLSWSLCCFSALSRPAEIVPQPFLLAKLVTAGGGGGSVWPRCRGTWSVVSQPPAPKPDTNTLLYPRERELAVTSTKRSSSLHQLVLYVSRAPHTVQGMCQTAPNL